MNALRRPLRAKQAGLVRASLAAVLAAGVACVLASPGSAQSASPPEWRGVVFDDVDGDGRRGDGEPGIAGVVVSNGREVVRSDAEGRYVLPARDRGHVSITRPAGARVDRWQHSGPGDFALRRTARRDEFFFIHFTDAHVYEKADDLIRYSSGGGRWWLPEWLRYRALVYFSERFAVPRFTPDLVGGLRETLAPIRDVSDEGAAGVMEAYLEEFSRPGSQLGNVGEQIAAAFQEMASLGPDFAVSTGDLILEGNEGSAEAIDRWMRFYRRHSASVGAPVYSTIGNNELAGTSNEEFAPTDFRYGKGLYRRHFGPTHYSFDRGNFHFVALDTHRTEEGDTTGRAWTFSEMPDDVATWLEADLAAHPDHTVVVLNHEPFHYDPSWPFDEDPDDVADDRGIFARHGVDYALAGHVHLNGALDPGGDATTHITTGALSGFRWLYPEPLYHRGYRLVYGREGRLYSAWKRTGRTLLAFIDPKGEAAAHPVTKGASEASAISKGMRVVVVGADRSGPFESLSLQLNGEPVALERWGRYFAAAQVGPTAGPAKLVLRARGTDGREETATLDVP